MWNFLLALGVGSAIGASRFGRLVKPLLVLIAIGVVIAGAIYVSVVFRAVQERSQHPHVPTHSPR
jgi:predicted MFS family arabinose efflux permease